MKKQGFKSPHLPTPDVNRPGGFLEGRGDVEPFNRAVADAELVRLDASNPMASEVGAGPSGRGSSTVIGRDLPTVLDEVQAGWPTRLTRLGVTATLGLLLLWQVWRAPQRWSEPALPVTLLVLSLERLGSSIERTASLHPLWRYVVEVAGCKP
jgi:hypothetical protein